MILPAAYLALVWTLVYMHRRRWQGFAILFGSLVPLAGMTILTAYASRSPSPDELNFFLKNLAGMGFVIHAMSALVGVMMLGIGLMLVAQPRVSTQFRCHECDYDLHGNETGVCPECGAYLLRDTIIRLTEHPVERAEPVEITPEMLNTQPVRKRPLPSHLTGPRRDETASSSAPR